MNSLKTKYMPVAMSDEIRRRIDELAARERRPVARMGEVLIELGLAEYERRQETPRD